MKAYYHLPGLFEFYELYKEFLPLYRKHREYFYDWCEIGSIYGAPADCVWGGGRVGFGEHDPKEVLKLMQEYGISARLTFSNSLLTKEHLPDKKCNELCRIFDIGRDNERSRGFGNGIIIYSDILLDYIKEKYSDEPEYLWEKFPDNAVFRNKNNQKWYAAILTVQRGKVGLEGDGKCEVIDLKGPLEKLAALIDNKNFLPGYHMNKKHWYTIRLDGSVNLDEIFKHIDSSYDTVN